MKKKTINNLLLVCTMALAVSLPVGINGLVRAHAEEVDATTIDTPFASVSIEKGAAVRYDSDGNGSGFSYLVKMNKTDYVSVTADDSIYTNVKFGVLIGPESYYDIHPFDTQANIDQYYSLNEKTDNHAFLYDMSSSTLVSYSETEVAFRGSIVGILDDNLINDYRGVAYVEYTKTVDGAPCTEKYFFTDDADSVRCPAEIADKAIADLSEDLKTAEESEKTAIQNKIDELTTTYVNKTAEIAKWNEYEKTTDKAETHYNQSGKYNKTPKIEALDLSNRYLASQYTTSYKLEKEGKESIAYVPGETDTTNLEGEWTLRAYTTCAKGSDNSAKVSYEKTITFHNFHDYVTVNGGINDEDISQTLMNGRCGDSFKWDEEKGMYTDVDQWYKNEDPTAANNYNTRWNTMNVGYSKKVSGNFYVDYTINGYGIDFRVVTNFCRFVGVYLKKDSSTNKPAKNQLLMSWCATGTGSTLITCEHDIVSDDGTFNGRIAYVDGDMYFYAKSLTTNEYELFMTVKKSETANDRSEGAGKNYTVETGYKCTTESGATQKTINKWYSGFVLHENSFKDGEFTFGFGSASPDRQKCYFNLTNLCTNDTDVKAFVNGEEK